MPTSVLYHAYGLAGYDYIRTEYRGNTINFHVRPRKKLIRCPACLGHSVILRGSSIRRLRGLPLGIKFTWLHVHVPRIQCLQCGSVRRVSLKIASPRCSYTHAFARYVVSLAQAMSLIDVARLLGIGWDLVKSIFKRYLHQRYSSPSLTGLEYVAIDEKYTGRKHGFITLVIDLGSGRVVYVGAGKQAEALDGFWKRLGRHKSAIKAVAADMSPAYRSAVLEHLPSAALVFDRFHVVKLMNERLTDIRRELYHELTSQYDRNILKGTRWMLLKNPQSIGEQTSGHERLELALQANRPLAVAYYMKEDLRQIWQQTDKVTATVFLDDWINRAQASAIKGLKKMAKMLEKHREGILNWYDHPISTWPLEGINNKIDTLKRQAYGYRDMEFFGLRIKALHSSKYALTG